MSVDAFIRLLKTHRAAAGMSQWHLSLHSGYDPSYVARIEAGKHPSPSRDAVLAFAAVLELTESQTDRLLHAAGLAPETDYQALWEAEHGAIEGLTKWCPRCESDLPAGPRGRFSRDRSRPDGLNPICKACDSVRGKAYRTKRAVGERHRRSA